MQQLHAYLKRIGYGGPLSTSAMTLRGIHRAHLLAIPFENVDVQLDRVPSLDIETIVEKIVIARRGGWCYEMNALLAWALRQLGFTVDYIAGAAGREKRGAAAEMNHLALIVRLDVPYLADVGFGSGSLLPLPLAVGTYNDGRFDFSLSRDGDWWRFRSPSHGGGTYDFKETPFLLQAFTAKAQWLATSPESSFVTNLFCTKSFEDGYAVLTNCALEQHHAGKIEAESAQNAVSLARLLDVHFDLHVEPLDRLWERVEKQHQHMIRKKVRGF
ncbi:MAG: arylamine N-acetyltransferase [Candidatus Baltobacteraceae bacterium]